MYNYCLYEVSVNVVPLENNFIKKIIYPQTVFVDIKKNIMFGHRVTAITPMMYSRINLK